MNKIAINTSQNVNIQFKVGSIGERLLAFILDLMIKGAYIILCLLLIPLNIEKYLNDLDQWSVMALLIIITLPINLYTLACESLMEGQTFGKKIVGLKVVKIDGYQASFGDYLMRWVFRLIDVYTNSGVVGLLSMVISKHNQRLGDLSTGTAVISLKNKINISHTILENIDNDYLPKFPQVISLSDNDMRIIKENFQKASKNQDEVILTKLTEKVKQTLKIDFDPKDFTKRTFLATIIKDYNYYTGKK